MGKNSTNGVVGSVDDHVATRSDSGIWDARRTPQPWRRPTTHVGCDPLRRTLFRSRIWHPTLIEAGLLGGVEQMGDAKYQATWKDADGRNLSADHTTHAKEVREVVRYAAGGLRVGPGRGSGVATGPFSRTAHRTRRADFSATGSPRCLPSGGVRRRPRGGDLVASIGVTGDRHTLLDAEALDPICGDHPTAGGFGQVMAQLTPVPAVPCPQHMDQPPPGEGVQLAEGPFRRGELKMAGPSPHDLTKPDQNRCEVVPVTQAGAIPASARLVKRMRKAAAARWYSDPAFGLRCVRSKTVGTCADAFCRRRAIRKTPAVVRPASIRRAQQSTRSSQLRVFVHDLSV